MWLAVLFFIAVVALHGQSDSPSKRETPAPFVSVPAVAEALRFNTQVPPFEAKDISGRTWRLEDLRGKWTLIYIWHTFEARAVDAHDAGVRDFVRGLSDLPEVQRFHDMVKHTGRIQVLTFCRDYDYTHASEYMKEKKYTFPVIADWKIAQMLFPNAAGNPPYWVADPDARLSFPIRSWSLGRLLYAIERAATR